MVLTAQLRNKIDELIAADMPRQVSQDNGIISRFSSSPDGTVLERVSVNEANRIDDLLNELSDQELVVVEALMTYGNDKGTFGGDATFEEAFKDAQAHVRSGRAHAISYVARKPLSKYLPAGLQRAQLD